MPELRRTGRFARWLVARDLTEWLMRKTVTARYGVAEPLETPEEMAACLEGCLSFYKALSGEHAALISPPSSG